MFDHLKIAFKWTHILNQLFCACPFVILKCGREKRFREQEKGERMGREKERERERERERKFQSVVRRIYFIQISQIVV